MAELEWSWLGAVPWAEARALQEARASAVARGDEPEALYLLEHPPIFTVGRHRAVSEALRASAAQSATPIVRTDRGGDLTWHGPGQLVVYPVVRLRGAGRGVRDFVAGLVEVLRDVVDAAGLRAVCDPAQPGLYLGTAPARRKLASVGIAVRRGVTLHGAALNLSKAASQGFDGLAPCGLEAVRATSLEEEGGDVAGGSAAFAPLVAREFAARFNFEARSVQPEQGRCS